ncbi:MAG TPA: hypothetical protein VFP87_10080 [Chitinophagaceae bacterium]|nr:hypothetical protein [Chitinophagaceae bacterium]
MKKIGALGSILIFLFACNSNTNTVPDVSNIKVNVEVQRFEHDLFSIDTNAVSTGLRSLIQKYPSFAPVFLGGVLGLPDSALIIEKEVRHFISLNNFIYQESEKQFPDLTDIKNDLRKNFQYVKYYFPSYVIPKIITLIGPIDAMAKMENGDYSTDFLGRDFLGISLQFYLGKDYSIYHAQYFIDNVAPLYRSRRFEKEYIPSDAMKLIVDDLFPDRSSGKPLIEQMIEKGKQWWLLDKFMPTATDSLKTGYNQKQLTWCKENEGLIWNYFVTGENLESIEPNIIQNYIGEGPTTQGMPPASPGNIGQWVGWQIVKKFANEHSSFSPAELMKTPPRKILTDSKYKPK